MAVTDIVNMKATFLIDVTDTNLTVAHELAGRLIASILSKRFTVLTGLAGSGKTKIAQALARWITPDPGWIDDADHTQGKNPNPYYGLVPVGADWTGNENIIGYPNGLDTSTYITKPALELIRHALDSANAATPHFLILDEMNLSHVERYFADILSAIESGEEIPLYEGTERMTDGGSVPRKLRLPENLFVIGTVNVDETTYMFSPKVLDRANVIEFRMEPAELAAFLDSPRAPRLEELDGKGIGFGGGFVEAAGDKGREVPAVVKADFEHEMLLFFHLLRVHNAEFGYRTGYEAGRFIHFYNQLGGYADDNGEWFDGAMDAVVVQKILPKLHGSRSKLEGLLWALAWACGAERIDRDGKDFAAQLREASQAQDEAKYGPELLWSNLAAVNAEDPAAAARYPLSYDKVMRMWRKLVRDQFVTFAEA
jgi:energy-coupling factor transporter ATP-binding protein EcfA2